MTIICIISRRVISCISGDLGLMLSVWIEIPQIFINRGRIHSNGNHSTWSLLSVIWNSQFQGKVNYLDINLSWRLVQGVTPITGIIISVRRHLYIELCPNNQTFGINFKVCVCQYGVLHKAFHPQKMTSTVYWCIASKLKAPRNLYWMSNMFLWVEVFLFLVCYHIVPKRHSQLDYEWNGL